MIIENKLFYHFQLNIFVMGLNSKTCWDMLMLEGQQIIFPSEERGLWFLWRHRRCFPVCVQRFLGGGTSVSTTAVRSRTLTWPSPWWWGGGRSTTGSTSSSPVSSSPPSPSSSSCCPPTPERRSPWVSAQLSLSVMTVTPILKVLPQRLSRLVKFTHCESVQCEQRQRHKITEKNQMSSARRQQGGKVLLNRKKQKQTQCFHLIVSRAAGTVQHEGNKAGWRYGQNTESHKGTEMCSDLKEYITGI